MMVRRTIAAGVGLLVLILLVIGVRGCLDARKERAIEDYADNAAVLVRESNGQSKELFALLQGSGSPDEAVDAQNKVNGFRVQSASIVDRARDLDVPDEVSNAHRYLLETLEFRRDGLARIAEDLPDALGDESRRQGSEGVARQMQVFLASDVIYAGRFRPSLAEVLAGPGHRRRDRSRQRLHPGHRVAPARATWPTRSARCAAAGRATTRPRAASTATVSWASPSAAWHSCPGTARPCRSPATSPSRSRWPTRATAPRRT